MAKEAKKKSKDHVLSQDEIDKLLEVITDGEEEFKPVEDPEEVPFTDAVPVPSPDEVVPRRRRRRA